MSVKAEFREDAINYSNFKVTRKLRDKQSSTFGAVNALNHVLSLQNGLSERFPAKAKAFEDFARFLVFIAVYQKCHSDLYSP